MNNLLEQELYNSYLPKLKNADAQISEILMREIKNANIPTLEITHRIKAVDSAIEKISRKPDNYTDISDLTDLIGFRIICYFSDDVDKIATVVERLFVVDRENSVDKRQIISPTAFGYLSLHYICSLPESKNYPKELCDIKFEIQIRSSLQHTWAEIEHDLGYKSVYSIPREIRREFSRIAGLLELADESFVRIRRHLNEYTDRITSDIKNGNAKDLNIDLVTLNAFIKNDPLMCSLLKDIASIQGSAITERSAEHYPEKLETLGISTIGELSEISKRRYDQAVLLAKQLLEVTELDEISSCAGLHFICRAELIYGSLTQSETEAFFMADGQNAARAKLRAQAIINKRRKIKSEG